MTDPILMADPYVAASAAAATVTAAAGHHQVAVVLGSGWAAVADTLGRADAEWSATDLGGPPAGVAGHAGVVRSVPVDGGRVLVVLGRVHAYEGHDVTAVVHAVRTTVAAGCATVVLTNAAGGIDPSYRVGQAVLVADHLNLTGRSPLTGPPPPEGVPGRFVDLTDLYSSALRARLSAACGGLAEGVYAGLPGPHYETPAEIRMLRVLGADLVGMSTVHEAIAARHLGSRVLGVSLVTNAAAGVTGAPLDHTEVVAAGAAATDDLGRILSEAIRLTLGHPR